MNAFNVYKVTVPYMRGGTGVAIVAAPSETAAKKVARLAFPPTPCADKSIVAHLLEHTAHVSEKPELITKL